ncbi:MAG: glycosyltransferase family 2 protein [Sphingobacteriaceae bacterium]
MHLPKVSIIIPAYNAEKYIAETIVSAKNQTWPTLEIIIVDDGSTDKTLEIAQSFGDLNILVFEQRKSGAAAARNLGLKKATGEYIQFLDADDLLDPDKITLQMQSLDKQNNVVAFGNTAFFFDGEKVQTAIPHPYTDYQAGKTYEPTDLLMILYGGFDGWGSMISVHSWLTPKNMIDKAGFWNEQLSVDDDGEFFNRIVLASAGVIYTPKAVNYYRKYKYGNSLSGQKTHKALSSKKHALDLKYNSLTRSCPASRIEKIFGRFYYELGVESYPRFKDISNYCMAKATQFNYAGKTHGSRKTKILRKIFGWRIARLASFYKHKI